MYRTIRRTAFLILALLLGACTPSQPFEPEAPLTANGAAEPAALPASMKGYELYSWQEADGTWRYTLITGTNRQKTAEELMAQEDRAGEEGWVRVTVSGSEALLELLGRLPAGESVSWIVPAAAGGGPFALPDAEVVAAVEQRAAELGVRLSLPQATEPDAEELPDPAATPSAERPATPAGVSDFQLPAGREPGWLYHGTEDPLPSFAFSPSGDALATGHRDGRVLLWDTGTGELRQALDRPVSAPSLGEITALAFSPDGVLLAAAKPGQGRIDLWRLPTGEFAQALDAGQGVTALAFSPDGRLLAGAIGRQQRPRVMVWDTETWATEATLEDAGPAVAFTQDSATVVTHAGASLAASAPSTDPQSAIVLWDMGDGTRTIPVDSFIVSVAYDAGQDLFAVNLLPVMTEGADPTPRTLLLQATSGAMLQSLAPPADEAAPPPTGPDMLAFSPDGALLAVGYQPNRIDLWQSATGEHLLTLRGPADWLRYPQFSSDGRLLAASSADGRILFWDVAALHGSEAGP